MATPVSAHKGGPPFLQINGLVTVAYSVPVTSVADFSIPQDMSTVNYRVGEKLDFTIDEKLLSLPPTAPANFTFEWDYDDGTPAQTGKAISHTYTKAGSHELDLFAVADGIDKTLVDSVLINVLPNADFVMPQPTIEANGKTSADPVSQPIVADLAQPVQFKAVSKPGTGKITGYYWDFGDGQSSTEANPKHQFSKYIGNEVAPMLRVKDDQGFYVDTYVWLKHDKDAAPLSSVSTAASPTKKPNFLGWVGLMVVVGLAGIAAILARQRAVRRKH